MKTVLVIEDNENNTELITFILKNHGYKTTHAETGMAGIDMVLQDKPDIILLDIQLPDIDGEQVLHRIRAQAAGKTVPIIAVTSYAMAGDRQRLLRAGCSGYIEKPIDPLRIIDQIKEIAGDGQ